MQYPPGRGNTLDTNHHLGDNKTTRDRKYTTQDPNEFSMQSANF